MMSDKSVSGADQTPEDDDNLDDTQAEREADRRLRMRFDWDNLIEDLIEDGRQRGLFDNLPGKGKPLDLGRPGDEQGNSLANQLLADNDLRPPWLAMRVMVDEKVAEFRKRMEREWRRYQQGWTQAESDSVRTALALGWNDRCKEWAAEVVSLNKQISDYNLRRPSRGLEMYKLTLETELERIEAPRYLN